MVDSRAVVLAVVAALGCSGAPAAPPPATPTAKPTAKPTTTTTAPAPAVELRFMEPARTAPRQGRAWVEISDAERVARLRAMADNEPARFALAVYATAWQLAPPAWPATPTLFIGLEQGGNYGRIGLVLTDADGERHEHPKLPYLILSETADSFRDTLLHESAHVMHGLLLAAVDHGIDREAIAPIPHSTAAVTDRRTAFNEGFAIHFETVAAHCGRDRATRDFYDHAAPAYRDAAKLDAEYFWPVRDLRTYAQTFARYQQVRDGDYAFEPATGARDYLRVQLDPARDRRTLRSAGSMVASEGWVASVLFRLATGTGCESLDQLVPRYRAILSAIQRAESEAGPLDAAPILDVVNAAGDAAIDIALDLSRGALVDARAGELWAELYDAALAVELEAFERARERANLRRAGWRAEVADDPAALARALGPVAVVTVPAVRTGLRMFGGPRPLAFDANAAGAPMLRLIPGVTEAAVQALLADRARARFGDAADAVRRAEAAGVPAGALVAGTGP